MSICKQTNRPLPSAYFGDEEVTWDCKILSHQSVLTAEVHLTLKSDLLHHSNSPTFKL